MQEVVLLSIQSVISKSELADATLQPASQSKNGQIIIIWKFCAIRCRISAPSKHCRRPSVYLPPSTDLFTQSVIRIWAQGGLGQIQINSINHTRSGVLLSIEMLSCQLQTTMPPHSTPRNSIIYPPLKSERGAIVIMTMECVLWLSLEKEDEHHEDAFLLFQENGQQ